MVTLVTTTIITLLRGEGSTTQGLTDGPELAGPVFSGPEGAVEPEGALPLSSLPVDMFAFSCEVRGLGHVTRY